MLVFVVKVLVIDGGVLMLSNGNRNVTVHFTEGVSVRGSARVRLY